MTPIQADWPDPQLHEGQLLMTPAELRDLQSCMRLRSKGPNPRDLAIQAGYHVAGYTAHAENVRPGRHRKAPKEAKQICVLLHLALLMETCSLGDNAKFCQNLGSQFTIYLHVMCGSPKSESLQQRAIDKVFAKRPLATIPMDMREQDLCRTN